MKSRRPGLWNLFVVGMYDGKRLAVTDYQEAHRDGNCSERERSRERVLSRMFCSSISARKVFIGQLAVRIAVEDVKDGRPGHLNQCCDFISADFGGMQDS